MFEYYNTTTKIKRMDVVKLEIKYDHNIVIRF